MQMWSEIGIYVFLLRSLQNLFFFFKLELIFSNTKELYQMLMLCMP